MAVLSLYWLPSCADWTSRLRALRNQNGRSSKEWWSDFVALARHDLDFLATDRLAKLRQSAFPDGPPPEHGTAPVRLALLGSLTLSQLEGGIIAGGLRRSLWVETYTADYGQYLQEIMESSSGLSKFKPTHILLAFDARTATGYLAAGMNGDEALTSFLSHMKMCWDHARACYPGVTLLQQTLLPVLPRTLGSNESRHSTSAAALIERINAILPTKADSEMVDLVDLSSVTAGRDLTLWYDPALWFKAKQEVTTLAAPLYGDIVARVLAAQQGRSAKCLVLDLDNTIWGGVIGDDGLDGIVLGQGSPGGEAFLAMQDHALALSRRGVILAVCSKNDEANALLPFESHPEMRLRRGDITAFLANWNDKASNIRAIAEMLNIGLDTLVFVDDNPFERNQVREALPMVLVPEVPDDPGLVPSCLADGGYFEGVSVTADDLQRREQYAANADRARLKSDAGDISTYLASLEMRMRWEFFRQLDYERTVQLINKTNQFNLTTRRMSGAEVAAIADDPKSIGLTFRLIDNFGDNGIIAVIIAHIDERGAAVIDVWLMSCRVLGRGVEAAALTVLVKQATNRGATSLVGQFVPSAKNGMVREHYAKLGFKPVDESAEGVFLSSLDIADYQATKHYISIEEPVG